MITEYAHAPAPVDLLQEWCQRLAGATRPRVVLADGDDERILAAAGRLAGIGITPILVGCPAAINETAVRAGIELPSGVEIHSPAELARGRAGDVVRERAGLVGPERSAGWLQDPLFLAVAAVPAGLADACVAGAVSPTADVLRAALRVVGLEPSADCVSSSFLMVLPDGSMLGFGDCAVVPEPDTEQLAEIAVATSRTFSALSGEEALVAMLSFSTLGSADHPSARRVRSATELVRERFPQLRIDGELQFDAAMVEAVAQTKAAGSSVAGRANVFIFPNLAAGNIAYKITQRLGGAAAYGPILQGLALPINDLSRGCTSEDVVNVAVISILQAQSIQSSPLEGAGVMSGPGE